MKILRNFYSINAFAESIFKEKGSRFIGMIYPLNNAEDLGSIIEQVQILHPKARHLCYAYRLLDNSYYLNDDGEPNNSAGKPIYNQILSAELHNVVVFVIRYFGGTKLGLSGLTSAYKTAAKLAIQQSKVLEFEWKIVYLLKVTDQDLSHILRVISQNKINIEDHQYNYGKNEITISLPNSTDIVNLLGEKYKDLKPIDCSPIQV
jgi:uncharacterized YigZ family protein